MIVTQENMIINRFFLKNYFDLVNKLKKKIK